MTKPIPDKAEVALEYPDKLYIGTFERTSRFDAHLDETGISLSLHRTGAADVVLLVDQLDRVLPAIKIARRSRFIALESVYAGLGLSVLGMIAAALGQITPVQGAIFQEVIDIAVILNALRALHDRSV